MAFWALGLLMSAPQAPLPLPDRQPDGPAPRATAAAVSASATTTASTTIIFQCRLIPLLLVRVRRRTTGSPVSRPRGRELVSLGLPGARTGARARSDVGHISCFTIPYCFEAVSYTHLRAHETGRNLVCRLLLEKKKT